MAESIAIVGIGAMGAGTASRLLEQGTALASDSGQE